MNCMQNYISPELTHFVGRSLSSDDERYDLFIKIIKSGLLRGKIDNGKGSTIIHVDPNIDFSGNESYNVNMVCFCDIPKSDFEIHMEKYSRFGIAFTKDFLIKQGVRPVYYIPKHAMYVNQNIAELFDKDIKLLNEARYNSLMKHISNMRVDRDNSKAILADPYEMELSQFIDMQLLSFIKFYDHNKVDDDIDNYYMEREWRSLERIEFQVKDIQRIIVPASYIRKFFNDINEYNGHVTTV